MSEVDATPELCDDRTCLLRPLIHYKPECQSLDVTSVPVPIRTDCPHDWMEFGGPHDEWRECFLCGRQEEGQQ